MKSRKNGVVDIHGFFFRIIDFMLVTVDPGDRTSNPGPSDRSSAIIFAVARGVSVSSIMGLVSLKGLSEVVTGDHTGSDTRVLCTSTYF